AIGIGQPGRAMRPAETAIAGARRGLRRRHPAAQRQPQRTAMAATREHLRHPASRRRPVGPRWVCWHEARQLDSAMPMSMRRFAFLLALLCGIGVAHAADRNSAQQMARVRVAFDRDGITSTRTDGYADPATRRAVSIDDPVRIASISKLVLTIGVMRLVEEGRLDLDADVSGALGWKLRNPNFPDVPITLRLLLSHTSSLTDGAGYWQVPLVGEFRTLLDDPKAWDAEHAPGRYWRYANVGFPLVGAAMERATGERLDLLMQRLVIQPLGLHACYGWPTCDEATAARAVVLYAEGKPEVDDNRGRKPACGITPASDGSCDLSKWRAG